MGLEISGVVQRVGQDVSSLSVNDHVVGMLPLDSPYSGCSRAIILHEYHAARIPSSLSHELAAGSVGDCVRAYTALYYLAHLQRDETVLVLNAASPFGTMVLQLAIQWGASQVFCTVCDKDEQFFLEDVLKLSSVIVMENVQSGNILQKKVLDQTAGLGIDIIVDSGVNMFRVEDGIQVNPQLPHKHDVISMLATGGRWVTSQANLQLDPPDSHLLHLKCASVCHLFEHAWLLSPSRLGCYQHILKDSMEKLCDGKLRVHIQEKVNLEEVPDAMKSLGERWGKVVIEL
ncbi:PREDICTED: quinone oxidoreductase-like protein 1 isoform X2 [Priapulus caudatus]|nr:PREDICTED: quinone oxidoreductase-like protein 1 isoform X2 [Priapulus caudatus]